MGSIAGSGSNRMRHVLSALVQNQPGVLADATVGAADLLGTRAGTRRRLTTIPRA